MCRSVFLITLSLLILTAFSQQTYANLRVAQAEKTENTGKKAGEKTNDTQIISSQQAVKQAKEKTSGRVIGVKLKGKGRESVYKVKVLTNKNKVKNVSIKANQSARINKKKVNKKNKPAKE